MGTNTPKALQNAVFYMVEKMFSLRGGVEMRQIKTSQVKRCTDPDRYVRPLENVPADPTKSWYGCTPVGKNTLENKLKKMCSLAGIEGRVTNHSLRATSVTQMYESGVPEKVIQE